MRESVMTEGRILSTQTFFYNMASGCPFHTKKVNLTENHCPSSK